MEFKGAELILLADMDAHGVQYIHPLGMRGMGSQFVIETILLHRDWL